MATKALAASASGDTTLITVPSGYRFHIKRLYLVAAAAVAVKFKSGATDITGVMTLAANQEISEGLAFVEEPAFLVGQALGDDFIINLGGAVVVGGFIEYDMKPEQ